MSTERFGDDLLTKTHRSSAGDVLRELRGAGISGSRTVIVRGFAIILIEGRSS